MTSTQLASLFQLCKTKITDKKLLPVIILFIMIALYSTVFSYLTILKFQNFGMYAWDLGIYHQAIHTTVTSGDLFFTTAEWSYTQTAIPPGTQFSVHFSPILFAVVPLYAVFPSPITLLFLKTIFIALGAVPVFLLARKTLNNQYWGLLFAAAYLLFPALQGVNWYDFQPQSFFPTLMLFTILFIEFKKNSLALLFAVLSMTTVEIAPFFIIATGLSYLLIQRKSFHILIKELKFRTILKSIPIALVIVGLLWFVLVFSMLILFGWQTSFHPSNTRRLDSSDFAIISAFSYDWPAKLTYLSLFLGPLAFLSLLSPIRLFPGAIWLTYIGASIYPPYYSLSFHYPTFAIPFVIIASIFGLKTLLNRFGNKRNQIIGIFLCFTIGISVIAASPIGPFHVANHSWAGPYGLSNVDNHAISLQKLVDLIPANASVLTDNNLFPHVSNRKNAYVFPFVSTFQNKRDFETTLKAYLQEVDFVLIDGLYNIAASTLFSKINKANDFGLYAEADGGLLFKKKYADSPVLFVPYEKIFTHTDLTIINGTAVVDSLGQSVLCHKPSKAAEDAWYGPGVFLSKGTYSVEFQLKMVDEIDVTASVLVLAVIAWPANVAVTFSGSDSIWFVPKLSIYSKMQQVPTLIQLSGSDFDKQDSYQTFKLHFSVEQPSGFEFVGLSAQDGTIYLEEIKLIQVSP